MIYTTLNRIRAMHPCQPGWSKLLNHLGKTKADDEPLSMVEIIESNALDVAERYACGEASDEEMSAARAAAWAAARDAARDAAEADLRSVFESNNAMPGEAAS